MATFKLYDCDVSVDISGTSYVFTHVQSLAIEDPERMRLTRGANAGNNIGVSYREGLKEAKTITLTVLDIPLALYNLLTATHKAQAGGSSTRVKVSCVSRTDGSMKELKNAIISQPPRQMNLDDSPESMDVALVFESYDLSETMKS